MPTTEKQGDFHSPTGNEITMPIKVGKEATFQTDPGAMRNVAKASEVTGTKYHRQAMYTRQVLRMLNSTTPKPLVLSGRSH